MNEVPPKKGWIDLIKNVYASVCRQYGIVPSEYRASINAVLVVLILIFGVYPFGKSAFNNFVSKANGNGTTNTASVSAGADGVVVQQGSNGETNIYTGGTESPKFNFEKGSWISGSGDLATSLQNPNKISFPTGTYSGLLQYKHPVPSEGIFGIRFKPLGDEAINFVVAIPSVYEVTIGDGDYQTVTLKRSERAGEPATTFVTEIEQNTTRPRLSSSAVKGQEIGVNLQQKPLPNKDLWVQLDISYWEANAKQKSLKSFKFEFPQPPSFADSLFLNIGMTQPVHGAPVGAELVEPSLGD